MRLAVFGATCGLAAALTACRQPQTSAPAAATSPAPGGAPEGRWCVRGTITDAAGTPLEGVEVTAHCGAGTLRRTGSAVSNARGEYTLRFGQGVMYQSNHSGLQAATIAPHRAGQVEKNLHRQGDLLMASRRPDEPELKSWGPHPCVVYPEEPQRVDFVMVPAAEISGRLLDADGKPIADHYVSLDAEELPPSSSVLASMKTDALGRFRFGEVPSGAVWLSIRSPQDVMNELTTARIECVASASYALELTYTAGPPPGLTARRVSGP
ncbi:MAG: hypothetical protein CHACPFDD_01489 [Phycisphaerae bacterium]|nr:hypothetical protein [Phycisphaerae bacterium]